MITKFHVRNYKALRDVSLELTSLHVLIGPNDSGKTSLLEAMIALSRSADHSLADSFIGTWDGNSLVSRESCNDSVTFKATFGTDDLIPGYELSCSFLPTGRSVAAARENVLLQTATVALKSRRSTLSFVGDVFLHDDSRRSMEGSDLAAIAEQIHELLAGAQYFRFNPSSLALPVAADSNRDFRMEPDGFGLALCLDNILGHDRARFDQLESHFRSIFPQIKAIKLKPQMGWKAPVDDPRMRPQLQQGDGKVLYFTFQNGKGDVSAEQMSDGVLLVLAYLTILHSPKPPRILLVEEPENGIHPSRLAEVLAILKRLVNEQQRTQVILTTHSPYVVDQFGPEQVTLCQQNQHGDVVVKRLSESAMVREQLDVFTLGEIWTAEGDEALAK